MSSAPVNERHRELAKSLMTMWYDRGGCEYWPDEDEIAMAVADAETRGRTNGINEAARVLSQGAGQNCRHPESWRELHERREAVLALLAPAQPAPSPPAGPPDDA